jgi:ABC-type bacteriocin/lantibiotic exporter with double-glycine peptidase domain
MVRMKISSFCRDHESPSQFWATRDAMDLLRMFAHLHGRSGDSKQLIHEIANGVTKWGDAQALLVLQALGFETKHQSGNVAALRKSCLPALAFRKDSCMLIIGRVTSTSVLIQRAGAKGPEVLRPEEFAEQWSGKWIAVRRSAAGVTAGSNLGASFDANADANQASPFRSGLTWFWRGCKKYLHV